MKRLFPSAAAATAALALGASAHGATLVTNGGFETNNLPSASGEVGVGTTGSYEGYAVSGWTISGFDILWYTSTAASASASSEYGGEQQLAASFAPLADNGNGDYFLGIDADPTYGGPVSQQINGLTAGKTYAVSFDWAGTQLTNRTGATTEQVFVCLTTAACTESYSNLNYGSTATVANGKGTAVYDNSSQGFSGWMSQTFDFTADATSETLTFLGFGTPGGAPPYALIDNVSVTAVPEPAVWATMLLGVAGVGALARRRRRAMANSATA
jgi:hypothetical protein